jgi:hypothetical protein
MRTFINRCPRQILLEPSNKGELDEQDMSNAREKKEEKCIQSSGEKTEGNKSLGRP